MSQKEEFVAAGEEFQDGGPSHSPPPTPVASFQGKLAGFQIC